MTEQWDVFKVDARNEPFVFRTKEDLESWVAKETNTWSWLWTKGAVQESGIAQNHFQDYCNAWSQGLQLIRNAQNSNDHHYIQWKNGRITGGAAGRLVLSDTVEGQDILALKETSGIVAARWAYLFAVGNGQFQQARTVEDFRGLILSAFPAMVGAEQYRDVLQRERKNYRDEVARVRRESDQFQQDRNEEWKLRYGREIRLNRRLLDRTKAIWKRENSNFHNLAQDSLAELEDTKNRYEVQMALAAPVKYWKDKSDDHGNSEKVMLTIAILYFITSLISLFILGKFSAEYIIELDKDVDRAAVYVIVSGGLLAFTTMIFWFGRVVMKLYLSEHHLRVDAAERSIMTQAYLAMTEQGSATEAERAIVLSSIFRPSPDGIVKDDGPADASIGGILSKILGPK